MVAEFEIPLNQLKDINEIDPGTGKSQHQTE